MSGFIVIVQPDSATLVEDTETKKSTCLGYTGDKAIILDKYQDLTATESVAESETQSYKFLGTDIQTKLTGFIPEFDE